MSNLKAKIAAVATFVAASGTALLMATSASAAATVPASAITNDPNAGNGTVTFYDASGNVITGGNNLSRLFDYAAASTDGRTGANKATIYFAFPDHTQADSQNWYNTGATTPATYPNATNPAPLTGPGFTHPVAKALAGDANLAGILPTTTQDTTAGYAGILQVRLMDSGPGVPLNPTAFWATDIYYDATAGTWQQVYPKVLGTSTTVSATPTSVTVGQNTTLTATVKDQDGAAVGDGSVQFKDGANNLGSAVNVNSSGVASTTASFATTGTKSISAVYTSTNTAHPTSTGTTSVDVTAAPVKSTNTTLAITGNVTVAGQGGVLKATITDSTNAPVSAGSVAFYDNGAATAIGGTVSQAANVFTLTLTSPDFTIGSHSIVAKFTPTDATVYAASSSAPSAFSTLAANDPCAGKTPGTCDNQAITATIPAGSITITTPYTAQNPLDLGTVNLNTAGTLFSGTATFDNIVVTDTRAGAQPWTASALASNMTSGANVINAQNLGLTGITSTPSAGFSGTVTPVNNTAANGVAPNDPGSAGLGGTTPHPIATADHGPGTVTMKGTLTLNAPTSTQAGVYNGTITFTVG